MNAPEFPATPLITSARDMSTWEARGGAPVTVLIGLWVMGIFGLYTGIQQQFLPRVFYDKFPGFGMTWVSPDGPFNEHLMRDLGGANLALTFLVVLAIATLIAQVPHFVYHALHLDLLPNTLERVLQTASLGVVLLIPVLVLVASHSMTEGRTTTRP